MGSMPTSILCWTLIATFAIFFSLLAIQQHRTFQTNALDLGNVDQAMWNTAQGRFLNFTLMAPVQSRLALHVEPILWLLFPLYWLHLGHPELLLIVQATVVALGAWPLYQLAMTKLTPSKILLIFPLSYLLLPTLEAAVLFDFHAVTLAPTFILFAYLALARQQDGRFIIFALLTMACKEDMPLLVAMIGLYIGLSQRRWRLAALTIGLSLVWFAVAFFIVQPHFATGGNIQLNRYAWLGDSPLAKVQTIFTNPKLVFDHLWYKVDLPNYLLTLFLPTAFLGLLSPLSLLPMLPSLAVNLLSDNPFTWRLEDFHYGAPLSPFLFIATIHTIARLRRWMLARRGKEAKGKSLRFLFSHSLILVLFMVQMFYHYHRGFTPLACPFNWPEITPHQQRLTELLTTIPPDVPLFTQSNLAPHLTHRRIIYSDFAYFTNPNFSTMSMPVEAVLLDVTSFENIGGLHQFLRQTLLNSPNYQLVTAQDGILYFHTVTANQKISPLPASLRPPQPSPLPYHLLADFGQQVRLRSHALHFNRQEEVQVTVELEPLMPLSKLLPVLYLLDAVGQPIGATTDLQPMLVWFPPETWPVGQTVSLRFNTLPWYTRQRPNYGLALGFITGTDVWNVSQRLRPTINLITNLSPRLAADGTLLELARIEQLWNMPSGAPLSRQFNLPQPSHRLQANFDQQIYLLGYDTPELANDSLTITLYWQAANLKPPTLTRFVQLIGSDGQIYGQNDSAPDHARYPTYLWQPGEMVTETIILPLPNKRLAGHYTLHLGFYHPDTGKRLPLVGGGDHVEVGVN